MPFYNCHIHIFSTQCAPQRFLEVGLPGWLDPAAGTIRRFLETRLGLWLTGKLKKSKISGRKTKVIARYASFASIGTMSTQKMVFENILQYYPAGTRFVVLTLNMDYMGAGPSELTFQGQIDEVIQLRRLYPDACLPFLSIDPRMGDADELLQFVKKYVGEEKPFIGIKLYPALGYFPFDCRLASVYRYCQEHNLPIMTHCTPSGAFFLGRLTDAMGVPCTIGNPNIIPHRFDAKCPNDEACDIFLQPNNWMPVLKEYPRLKVCFAHMGGVGEIWKERTAEKPLTWYDDVKALMAQYENVYTDISYTLFDKTAQYRTWEEIRRFLLNAVEIPPDILAPNPVAAGTLKDRIMFGTDYFMTEQEDPEKNLAAELPNWLVKKDGNDGLKLLKQLSEKNTERFLESNFFKP